jgi:hypothetical protein
VILTGIYNLVRFGSLFEFGLDFQILHELFIPDHEQYGFFNLHYFPKNFYYQYIAYPIPYRPETFLGGSLFLLSPLFFGVFWGLQGLGSDILRKLLLSSMLLVNVPILFILGTGWVQFGPRYSLDFMMPLLLLTSMGIRRWPVRLVAILTLISVIHYTTGAIVLAWFMN